ncbi:MAG: peptide deformylase [Deltaproteobacteria bacterium]|nr:peptide deformylase [Deltaproteobacteria bacterium]
MAVRELKIYPDPVLREHCRQVENISEQIHSVLDDLAESMYAHKGIGLAAPQIGETIRIVVVDVEQKDGTPKLIELINPEITESSEACCDYEEGCLSFPGEAHMVTRPARVTLKAQDRQGDVIEFQAEGLLATALQHELDHLDGELFIDHLSRLKRSMIVRRMKKRAREATR